MYHLVERSGVVKYFIRESGHGPEGCAVHHAAGHVLAVALVATCLTVLRTRNHPGKPYSSFQTAAAAKA